MCNRYASDIRKAGLEFEYYGFQEWSETRINAVLEVFPKSIGPVLRLGETGTLARSQAKWEPVRRPDCAPNDKVIASDQAERIHARPYDAMIWDRMRWGLPGPPQFGGAPVTNIRNLASPHWRALLGPEHRCLVPFTAFSEYEDASPKGAKRLRWFAPPDRGMLCFAGIWRSWRGDYGSKKEPNVGEHKLFSFLTTAPNDLVRPIHAKAMPVVLRNAAEREEWLHAPTADVTAIQARPLPSEALEIVPDEEAAQFVGAYLK